MRALWFAAGLALTNMTALPMATAQVAQPDPQELASVRAELAALLRDIQSLRALQSASAEAAPRDASDVPLVVRLDALEAEMRTLTGRVEELDFKISAIALDGTRRIGDLEFRLVELEGGDLSAIGPTSLLGADAAASAPPSSATDPQAPATEPGVAFAVSEKSDFDAALSALNDGQIDTALAGFDKFLADYPGGPLAAEAMFHIGEAETQQGAHKRAAKAYLDAFTAAPDGAFAPHSLMKVGLALGQLGKPQEACATLEEVLIRYPGSPVEEELVSNQQMLGCS